MNNRLLHRALVALIFFTLQASLFFVSCTPEPPLHLYDAQEVELEQPVIDLNLEVYWDYELDFGLEYDWKTEWYYGWDEEDRRLFGELGYTEPTVFNLRRYYTVDVPYAPHNSVVANTVNGRQFRGQYDWGFWDILVWNDIHTLDGVQSLIFDEETTLDSVTAYTNQSMHTARYNAPRYTRSFYQPEPLFSAYEQAIEVNRDLRGFEFDSLRNVYVKQLNMMLRPITYIYLTQVILHHNRGRIISIDGSANLSGFARNTTVNTGVAGSDAITVYYATRLKRDCPMVPFGTRAEDVSDDANRVDIVGGRLMTFGLCDHNSGLIARKEDVHDKNRHYMDLLMQFNNGVDSTFVFDVTDQVRRRYKGGVITVELDLDTIPIPSRNAGSGFNAIVAEPDSVTHEIEL